MTWEYSGDPATSTKDQVRFLIGDTDEVDPQLQDEEIDYLLTSYGSPAPAASAAARAIAGHYARLVNKTVGDLSINYSDRVTQYRELAGIIDAGGGAAIAPLSILTSRTVSDRDTARSDTDRLQPNVSIGMDDNPDNSISQPDWRLP